MPEGCLEVYWRFPFDQLIIFDYLVNYLNTMTRILVFTRCTMTKLKSTLFDDALRLIKHGGN